MVVPPPVQLPFSREDESNGDAGSAADAIIARLMAKVAQLEDQVYARELEDGCLQSTNPCQA